MRPGTDPAGGAARVRAARQSFIPPLHRLLRETPGTLSMGQGVVFFPPPEEARAALRAASGADSGHAYGPTFGTPELLRALEHKLRVENGIEVGPLSRVVVTAGSNMAFFQALLAITDPGDEVILPVPYYFNHEMAAVMLGCRVVPVPVGADWQPELESLRRAISTRTRALVTVSPNNPTGAVYTPQRLAEINRLCAERGIYHLSDEAYEYFTYGAARHCSPGAERGAAGHTISLFSFSKAYGMAGWRLGYLVLPAHLEAALEKIQDTNLICPPRAMQEAALGALRAGRAYCRRHLERIAAARAAVLEEMARAAGAPCSLVPGQGAFYLLPRVELPLDDRELAERLVREHRVAVLPGSGFGLREGCFLRMSYGDLEPAEAPRAVRRLLNGLHACAGRAATQRPAARAPVARPLPGSTL